MVAIWFSLSKCLIELNFSLFENGLSETETKTMRYTNLGCFDLFVFLFRDAL